MESNILLDQLIPASAESVFLASGLDSGCAPPGLDSAFAAGESVFVFGIAVLEPVFGVTGLELVGLPVDSDWARVSAAPTGGGKHEAAGVSLDTRLGSAA